MSAIKRFLNKALNLQTQLSDADRAMPLRVFTDLLKADGSLIKTIELTHTSKGVFIDNAELMPDESLVMARHYVYSNDGVTLDQNYAVGEDRYELIEITGVRGLNETTIKVKQDTGVIINTSSNGATIKDVSRSNVKILVSDDDTEIKTDSENVNIGV